MNHGSSSVIVTPASRIGGEISVPGDKSISQRLALLCGIASGESVIHGFLRSEDCLHTLGAMTALGARAHFDSDELLRIEGNGGRFLQPVGELDLGNSGTGLRLLTGLLAGRPIEAVLTGDESLRSRPQRRIADPLQAMGAVIETLGPGGTAPLRVRGGALRGLQYDLPVASAQVKSAILLAGLFAEGVTRVRESVPTRDHTERLLRAMGVEISSENGVITLRGYGADGPNIRGEEWQVPGDFSSAAFWFAAAAARPNAEVTVAGVGLNPRRTAFLDVLRRMGAEVVVERDLVREPWEPTGRVTVRGRNLRGVEVGGAEIPNLIDEIPVLTAIAALAEGETVVRDARELRVKESDRIAVMAANLRRLGVEVEELEDGLVMRGPARLKPADDVRSHGDHRVAMAMAVLALHAPGPVVIHGVGCVATSYPSFWKDLERLTQ